MTTLARINGEALAVPGLRFWGRRQEWHGGRTRVAIIASSEQGHAEVWTYDGPLTPMGGVELHSPRPFSYDPKHSRDYDDCEITGGDCWTDGSALAWDRDFMPLIAAGDSAGVLAKLADWHDSHFGAGVAL